MRKSKSPHTPWMIIFILNLTFLINSCEEKKITTGSLVGNWKTDKILSIPEWYPETLIAYWNITLAEDSTFTSEGYREIKTDSTSHWYRTGDFLVFSCLEYEEFQMEIIELSPIDVTFKFQFTPSSNYTGMEPPLPDEEDECCPVGEFEIRMARTE